ncbi:hypothetical protein [Vallitalea okinawensis]|uniref:hypothetical protein n=1 Tax=Vallitalea okinawensis TaxID=2078660 RepID=UPI000CFCA195|nr:hypothetical protein [Vallitalea okinawensis]
MKTMRISILSILIIVSIAISGCVDVEYNEEYENSSINKSTHILDRALQVTRLLYDKDMNELSNYVHQDKGVRFIPYSNVTSEDLVFMPSEVVSLYESEEKYTWGSYDGSGEPIEVTFKEYYEEFVYDMDFANADIIGNNTLIGEGNSIVNIHEEFPDSKFVEFHFTGENPEYGGMDWSSLRLIFEEVDGNWYLVGIGHGQWTI